jgi:hypothetical protein
MGNIDGIGGSGLPGAGYPNVDDLGGGEKKGGGLGRIIVLVVVVIVGAIGAFVVYTLSNPVDTDAHNAFRNEVFAPVHTKFYEPFWRCVLRDPVRNFKSAGEIREKIKAFSFDNRTQAYAEFIKSEPDCLPLLDKMIPEYAAMSKNAKTPTGYGVALLELQTAIEDTKRAWTAYQEYESHYRDRHNLLDRIDATSKAWVGYQSSVRNKVPEKIAVWLPNAMPYVRYIKCALGDTSFTSFEVGEPGNAIAQNKLLEVLDGQCDSNKSAFLLRLEELCRPELAKNTQPEEQAILDEVTDYWNKADNDFGSAVPINECLTGAEETQTGRLMDAIAKTWGDYVTSYNKLVELNNAFLGKTTESAAERAKKGRGSKAPPSGEKASEPTGIQGN